MSGTILDDLFDSAAAEASKLSTLSLLSTAPVCNCAQHDPVARAYQESLQATAVENPVIATAPDAALPSLSAGNAGLFDVTTGLDDGPIRLGAPGDPIPPGMKFFFEVRLRYEGEFRGEFQTILQVGDNFATTNTANAIVFRQFFGGSEVQFEVVVNGQGYPIFGPNSLIQGETATWRIQVTDSNIAQLFKNNVLLGQREVPDISVIPRQNIWLGQDAANQFVKLWGEFVAIRSDINDNGVDDGLVLPAPNLPRPTFVEPRAYDPNPVPGGVVSRPDLPNRAVLVEETGNSIVDALTLPYKWRGDVITYGFVVQDIDNNGLNDWDEGGGSWRSFYREILGNIESFTTVRFWEQDVPASTMSFRLSTGGGGVSGVPGPDQAPQTGTIVGISPTIGALRSRQEFIYQGLNTGTWYHEIGHALGLSHPFETPNGLDDGMGGANVTDAWIRPGDNFLNSKLYSVMLYADTRWGENNPFTTAEDFARGIGASYGSYMPFDIAALQQMYGVNRTTALGDNLYTFNDNFRESQGLRTIWDNGGTDTIQYTGTQRAVINLNDATLRKEIGGGGFLSTSEARMTGFLIANGVTVENAIGGALADTLVGNEVNNTLTGGRGSDLIDGGAGFDTAVITGTRTGATVTSLGDGRFTVRTSDGDTDTLRDVERIVFQGGGEQILSATPFAARTEFLGLAPDPTFRATGTGYTFLAEATVRYDNFQAAPWQRVFDFSNGGRTDAIWLGQWEGGDDIAFRWWDDKFQRYWDIFVPDAIINGEVATWKAQITSGGLMQLFKNGALLGETQSKPLPDIVRTNLQVGQSSFSRDSPLIGQVLDINADTNGDGRLDVDFGVGSLPALVGSSPVLLTEETFANGATGWSNTTTAVAGGNRFLGQFGTGPVQKTFALPGGTTSVVVEFDFLEIDSWEDESFLITVNGRQIDLGRFAFWADEPGRTFTSGNVTVQKAAAVDVAGYGNSPDGAFRNDNLHKFLISVAAPGDQLTLGFRSTLNQPIADESFGIDNVKVRVINTGINEAFASGASGWSNNTTTVTGGNGYLGQFGRELVQKTFALSAGVSSATITFDFLEIDSWDGESFFVVVNGQEINLGAFQWWVDEGATSFTAGNVTVRKAAAVDIAGYGNNIDVWSQNDNLHKVTLTVAAPGDRLTLGFRSTVDPNFLDESYGIDNLQVTATAPMILADETFGSGASGWSLNRTAATAGDGYLGQFGREMVQKTFALSAGVSSATITFDFLEIDSWDGESFFVVVNGQEINLGAFQWWVDEGATSVTAGNVTVRKAAAVDIAGYGNNTDFWAFNDNLHKVTLTVAAPGDRLTLGFRSTVDPNLLDESYGIDNLRITAPAPITNLLVANETFASGASGWSNNTTTVTGGNGYLGQFGRDLVQKTFALPVGASSAIIEFDFLEIDSWDGESFFVVVNGQEINLGAFNLWVDEGATSVTAGNVTVRKAAAVDIAGYGNSTDWWAFNDNLHKVTLTVAAPGDRLTLGFRSTVDPNLLDESYGIDNLRITATAPMILADETFGSGASGWSLNRTAATAGDGYLGQFGRELVQKTFALPAGVSSATITFDFLEIDSWDGESFFVVVNGQEINLGAFQWWVDEGATSVTAGNVTVRKAAAVDIAGYGNNTDFWAFNDNLHKVTLTVAAPGDRLTLGFRSTVDPNLLDESYGVDNLRIAANTAFDVW